MDHKDFQKAVTIITRTRDIIKNLNDSVTGTKPLEMKCEIVKESIVSITELRDLLVNEFKSQVFKRFACEELTVGFAAVCGVQVKEGYDSHSIEGVKPLILATIELEEQLKYQLECFSS